MKRILFLLCLFVSIHSFSQTEISKELFPRELTAPDTRLFLFCGTDMFLTLDQWYCADEIFKLCYPIYIRRENDQLVTNKILKKIGEYTEKYNAVVRRVVTEPIELSSTQIRKRVAEGKSISGLVPQKVESFILENGLYRAEVGE